MLNFTEHDLEDIRSIVDKANDISKNAEYIRDHCEARQEDILHELEFKDLSYHERAKLATELRDIRRQRREAKNQLQMLEPFMKWKEDNRVPINNLNTVIGKMRGIADKQESAIYKSRVNPKEVIASHGNKSEKN